METTRAHYCDITKKLLLFVGQWPYQKKSVRQLRTTMTSVAILSTFIPQTCKLIHCNGNPQCILGTMPFWLISIIVIVKLYTCQFNSSRIKDLTDRLFGNWKQLETIEEYEIMKTYTANGRLIVLIYSLCCFVGIVIFMSVAFIPRILDIVLPLNKTRPVMLPFEAYYFVDEEEYFFYIFVQAFVPAVIAIAGLVAHDCMLFTYLEHVCSVFAIAGFRSQHLVHKRFNVVDVKNKNIYDKKIAVCVNMHCSAIEYADLLENTFSISFTIQIGIITIAMSVTLVRVMLQSENFLELMRYIMYVVVQLLHLFIFSWQGQKLIDHSVQMHDKIYNSFWYYIPVKSQKLLLHIMRRSLQPNSLNASRIYIFSLESFITVVQASLSYFTVFASIQ